MISSTHELGVLAFMLLPTSPLELTSSLDSSTASSSGVAVCSTFSVSGAFGDLDESVDCCGKTNIYVYYYLYMIKVHDYDTIFNTLYI